MDALNEALLKAKPEGGAAILVVLSKGADSITVRSVGFGTRVDATALALRPAAEKVEKDARLGRMV